MTFMLTFFLPALLLAAASISTQPDGLSSVAAATDRARVRARAADWQGATQRFVFTPGGLYQVETAVGRVTDIALQPGEGLSDTGAVAAGDTVRWVIGEASSGTGATRVTHILVKPTEAGLATNLIIGTTKRSYHVELRSTRSSYMASVAWSYPQDELIAIAAARREAEAAAATEIQRGLDPARLNFAYRLTGDAPPWRPTQAFDDGTRTYLLFPASISESELPPLFLIGEKGEAALINYRVSGRTMVVDRLFDRAELRLGSKRQQVVRIARERGR